MEIVFVCKNNLDAVQQTLESIKPIVDLIDKIVVIDSSNETSIENFLISQNFQKNLVYKWTAPNGIYSAMNNALDLITPEKLIWFLNPGDTVQEVSAIRELVSLLDDRRFLWGFTQAVYKSPDSLPFPAIAGTSKSLLMGRWALSHQSVIAYGYILREIGYFDRRYEIAADLDVQQKLLSKYDFVFIRNPGVAVDVTGVSHKFILKTYWESYLVRLRSGQFSVLSAISVSLKLLLSRALKSLSSRFSFSRR